jgi:hypothetical protein
MSIRWYPPRRSKVSTFLGGLVAIIGLILVGSMAVSFIAFCIQWLVLRGTL